MREQYDECLVARPGPVMMSADTSPAARAQSVTQQPGALLLNVI